MNHFKSFVGFMVVIATGVIFTLLLNLFMPLWASVIISIIITPVSIALLAALMLAVAYPVVAMYIVLAWGLYLEGKKK